MGSKFLKCLKIDFRYMVKSKFIIGFAITLISLVGILSWAQYAVGNSSYREYAKIVDIHKNNERVRKEQIKNGEYDDITEFDIETNNEKEMIQLTKYNLVETLKSISPKYAISCGFENALGFWAMLFFVLGSIVASKDYKNNMLKYIALRGGKVNYILAKITSVILTTIATVLAYMLLVKLGNGIANYLLAKKMSHVNLDLGTIKTSYNIFVQFGVMTFLALVFSLMGALFSTIFKKSVVGITIATAYLYVIPPKLKYEPKSMLYNIMGKYLDFKTASTFKIPVKNNVTYSFVFLSLILLVSALIMVLVNKKRSAYR